MPLNSSWVVTPITTLVKSNSPNMKYIFVGIEFNILIRLYLKRYFIKKKNLPNGHNIFFSNYIPKIVNYWPSLFVGKKSFI